MIYKHSNGILLDIDIISYSYNARPKDKRVAGGGTAHSDGQSTVQRPQSRLAASGGAGCAAPRAADATQKQQRSPRRVATSTPIDHYERTHNGAQGSAPRGAPTPCPQPNTCPTLQQAPLPISLPSQPPSCMMGRQGCDAWDRAVRGPRRGCWRVPAVCVRAREGGLAGLGMGGQTRKNV